MSTQFARLVSCPLRRGNRENMNINLNGTKNFHYLVPKGWVFELISLNLVIQGANPFDGSTFGDIPALATGCSFVIFDDRPGNKTVLNFLDGTRIKTNADFGLISTSSEDLGGANCFVHRINFASLTANGEGLIVPPMHRIAMRIRDNLSGLASFRGMIYGRLSGLREAAV